MPTGPLAQFGPSTVTSGFEVGAPKRGTAVSRLAAGGAVVAWLSNSVLLAQRLDASGQVLGSPTQVGTVGPGAWSSGASLSVAGTADGGWVVAWASASVPPQFQLYDASGAPIGSAVLVDATVFAAVSVQVRAMADGSFVVAWSGGDSSTNQTAYVRKFSAAGAAQTARMAASSGVGQQSDVNIAALPDGTFLVAWMGGSDAYGNASTIVARHLDASLSAAGPEQTIMQNAGATDLSLTSLADGTTLIAWGARDLGVVQWQLLDATGAATIPPTSSIVTSAQFDPYQYLVDTVEAVPAAGGFTIAVESTYGGPRWQTGRITVLAIAAHGALAGRTELGDRNLAVVSEIVATTCGWLPSGVAAAGGDDGRYVLAYDVCENQGTQGIVPSVDALAR